MLWMSNREQESNRCNAWNVSKSACKRREEYAPKVNLLHSGLRKSGKHNESCDVLYWLGLITATSQHTFRKGIGDSGHKTNQECPT